MLPRERLEKDLLDLFQKFLSTYRLDRESYYTYLEARLDHAGYRVFPSYDREVLKIFWDEPHQESEDAFHRLYLGSVKLLYSPLETPHTTFFSNKEWQEFEAKLPREPRILNKGDPLHAELSSALEYRWIQSPTQGPLDRVAPILKPIHHDLPDYGRFALEEWASRIAKIFQKHPRIFLEVYRDDSFQLGNRHISVSLYACFLDPVWGIFPKGNVWSFVFPELKLSINTLGRVR